MDKAYVLCCPYCGAYPLTSEHDRDECRRRHHPPCRICGKDNCEGHILGWKKVNVKGKKVGVWR